MFEKEITFDRFIRGALVVAGLGLAIYIMNLLSAVLLPFFVAWLLAYLIHPAVKFFQFKLRLRNRILCILITLLLILGAIAGLLYLIIPPVISEVVQLRNVITDFITETGNSDLARQIESYLQKHFDQNTAIRLLRENNIMEAMRTIANQVWNLLSQTFNILFALLSVCMVFLYLFLILMDYESLSEGWIKLIPKRNRRFASVLVEDVQHGMNSYFRGQALVAFIVGILFSAGFLIIDFPMAIGLGMFIGLLNLVPYLQAVGIVPTVILALLEANETGENFWWILLCATLVFVVVQCIQDLVLVPRIMGKLMGLNPAVVLLSLSVWGSLLGLIGLIIALPLTTLLLSYYRRFIERDERRIQVREERQRRKSTPPRQESLPQTVKEETGSTAAL